MKVLLAEDEELVHESIKKELELAGMNVDSASNRLELLGSLENTSYDVIVLDRRLEGWDALLALEDIRQKLPAVKILILSALSDVDERVKGLKKGADDYLGKPFHESELIARIHSLVRRETSGGTSSEKALIAFHDLKIDLDTQKVFRGGKKIALTKKEFQILTILARHPGTIFSKAKILNLVWDRDQEPDSNIIEVTIANLRQKIDRDFNPVIQSHRGRGYSLGTS